MRNDLEKVFNEVYVEKKEDGTITKIAKVSFNKDNQILANLVYICALKAFIEYKEYVEDDAYIGYDDFLSEYGLERILFDEEL